MEEKDEVDAAEPDLDNASEASEPQDAE